MSHYGFYLLSQRKVGHYIPPFYKKNYSDAAMLHDVGCHGFSGEYHTCLLVITMKAVLTLIT